MLLCIKPEPESQLVLEPVEDLTESYLVYLDEIYIGRVFKSICFPRWLTSGLDDGRYGNAVDAAIELKNQWKARPQGQDNLPF